MQHISEIILIGNSCRNFVDILARAIYNETQINSLEYGAGGGEQNESAISVAIKKNFSE